MRSRTFPTTYSGYTEIVGGLVVPDTTPLPLGDNGGGEACVENITQLELPSSSNMRPFVYPVTATGGLPEIQTLPPALIDYLDGVPSITERFNGTRLDSCTTQTAPNSPAPSETLTSILGSSGVALTEPRTQYTTIMSTSIAPEVHISVSGGPLRSVTPSASGEIKPVSAQEPSVSEPQEPPADTTPQEANSPISTPGIGDVIKSILEGNPLPIPSQKPSDPPVVTPGPTPNNPTKEPPNNVPGEWSITINNTPVAIAPLPSSNDNSHPPGIIVGSQTLALGQATTINGVFVSILAAGTNIIIAGSNTVALPPPNAASTQPPSRKPPILSLGTQTLTANPLAPSSSPPEPPSHPAAPPSHSPAPPSPSPSPPPAPPPSSSSTAPRPPSRRASQPLHPSSR